MTDKYNSQWRTRRDWGSQDTRDDHMIALMLAEDERLMHSNGMRPSQLNSIPHVSHAFTNRSHPNYASLYHESLADRLARYRLAELQIQGDGNCQFRALADQLFHKPDQHKYIRKQIVRQLKDQRNLYEGYVDMSYKHYVKKMNRLGEWGDHVTLQAAADKFEVKICLITTFRDSGFIEILPKDKTPYRELWLSFWSNVHYNSLYPAVEAPLRRPRKKHWLFHVW